MSNLSELPIPPKLWILVDEGKGDIEKMQTVLNGLSENDLLLFFKEFRFATDELVAQLF